MIFISNNTVLSDVPAVIEVESPPTDTVKNLTDEDSTALDADSVPGLTEIKLKNDTVSKSWFCVFPNPEEHGFEGTPEEIVNTVIERWIEGNPQRTCAVTFCISKEGLIHLHGVFEDTIAMRFSKIKSTFPGMHIEPTKGNKKDAEDYINKRGKFKESGEQIIYANRHGEIKGATGKQRNELEIIEELIKQGLTPNEIFDISIQYRRYEKIIKNSFYRKRFLETPTLRDVTVYWHTGSSGSGKSYTRVILVKEHGEENIYTVSQFDSGYMDKYSAEDILFIDELRANIRYSELLILLDRQKHDIHARYGNVYGLWTEVHITSVFPPDILYGEILERQYKDITKINTNIDTYEQLRRRINFIVYHYKEDEEYCSYTMPMKYYRSYDQLQNAALLNITDADELEKLASPAGTTLDFINEEVPEIETVYKPSKNVSQSVPKIEADNYGLEL